MNCNQYREWLSADLDGMLGERQARRLRAHLAECPACRQVKADLEKTVGLLRALPEVAPPADLPAAVRRKVAAARPVPLVWRILVLPQTRLALAAALLMVIVIYGYQPMSLFTRPHEPVQARGVEDDKPAAATRQGEVLRRSLELESSPAHANLKAPAAESAPADLAYEKSAEAQPDKARWAGREVGEALGLSEGYVGDRRAAAAGPAPAMELAEESSKSVPRPGLSAVATRAKAEGDRVGLDRSVMAADSLAAAPPARPQATLVDADKETRELNGAVAPARKPDASFKQAAAKDAAAPRPAEIRTDLPPPAAAPAALTLAAAPPVARLAKAKASVSSEIMAKSAQPPGATWLVVTADPDAVLKAVSPYRRMPEEKKGQAETVVLASDRADRLEAAAEEPAPAGAGGGGRKVDRERASVREAGLASALPSGDLNAAETLLTLWVPAADCPALFTKLGALGEVRDESRLVFRGRLGAEGMATEAAGTNLVPVQIRLRPK